ncbi:MAG: amidohydrolase [Bacteroidetes bacterium]|nr:amidohydrolase [Bacteroidota bacterium]
MEGTQVTLAQEIHNLAAAYFEEIRQVRRELHAHPEPSFEEEWTSGYLAGLLEKEGIRCERGWAKTGLVATIVGNKEGHGRVGLRADMDALPIHEGNEVPYRSGREGWMHACGHDVHMACLLGAALLLHDTRAQWGGEVKLVFQPGEELLPGGAQQMLAQGLLEKHPVDAMFALHVMPELPVGSLGFRAGRYMAACDELHLEVVGRGGHGALPHLAVDPILIGAHIVVGLQQVVSRKAWPLLPTVLSIGHFEALGATNVIPGRALLKGTLRTYDEDWRSQAHREIEGICRGTAEMMGGHCKIDIVKGYPSLYNDPALTGMALARARELVGPGQVVELDLRPTGEDFAYYGQRVPSCFFRLGTGGGASVHHPEFDIDETALVTGMAAMAYEALGFLGR